MTEAAQLSADLNAIQAENTRLRRDLVAARVVIQQAYVVSTAVYDDVYLQLSTIKSLLK